VRVKVMPPAGAAASVAEIRIIGAM
jgi:hypothetical protein